MKIKHITALFMSFAMFISSFAMTITAVAEEINDDIEVAVKSQIESIVNPEFNIDYSAPDAFDDFETTIYEETEDYIVFSFNCKAKKQQADMTQKIAFELELYKIETTAFSELFVYRKLDNKILTLADAYNDKTIGYVSLDNLFVNFAYDLHKRREFRYDQSDKGDLVKNTVIKQANDLFVQIYPEHPLDAEDEFDDYLTGSGFWDPETSRMFFAFRSRTNLSFEQERTVLIDDYVFIFTPATELYVWDEKTDKLYLLETAYKEGIATDEHMRRLCNEEYYNDIYGINMYSFSGYHLGALIRAHAKDVCNPIYKVDYTKPDAFDDLEINSVGHIVSGSFYFTFTCKAKTEMKAEDKFIKNSVVVGQYRFETFAEGEILKYDKDNNRIIDLETDIKENPKEMGYDFLMHCYKDYGFNYSFLPKTDSKLNSIIKEKGSDAFSKIYPDVSLSADGEFDELMVVEFVNLTDYNASLYEDYEGIGEDWCSTPGAVVFSFSSKTNSSMTQTRNFKVGNYMFMLKPYEELFVFSKNTGEIVPLEEGYEKGYIDNYTLYLLAENYFYNKIDKIIAIYNWIEGSGDLNVDYVLDIVDVATVRAHIVNMQRISEHSKAYKVADVNSDGLIDIVDVVKMRDKIVNG